MATKNNYLEGAIVRIKMTNFMTYTHLEVRPQPRMNIILGPNGTGKSTIICAICLGLGGKPGVIARAAQIGDYVKRGCDTADIELEICNANGPNYIIHRQISKNSRSSKWSLNGNPTNENEVDALMKRLNVQVSNLCQFLPQDRVADFVKMTPQDLLENAEKASGDPEIFENHCLLRNWHIKFQLQELAFEEAHLNYNIEMQKQTHLEEQVRLFQERQHHFKQIKFIQKKKAFMEYEVAKGKFKSMKQLLTRKEKELEPLEDQVNTFQRKIREYEQKTTDAEDEIKKAEEKWKVHSRLANDKIKQVSKLSDKISEIWDEYKAKEQMENHRAERINGMKQQLSALENELSAMSFDEDGLLREISEVNQEINQTNATVQRLEETKEDMSRQLHQNERDFRAASEEKSRLENVHQQRLERLRQKDRDAYSACVWLAENRNLFKKTIHEPIMISLSVQNPNWAKYVEHQVPFKDLVAFVCEDPDDMEVFMSNLRDRQNLKINAVLAPAHSSEYFQSEIPLDNIKRWGFHSYLKSMVDGPDAVISYLCRQYHFHGVPVGNAQTKDRVENVLSETNFRRFYTENHRYTVAVSKYGNRAKSTTSTVLTSASLLTVTADPGLEGQILLRLQNCRVEKEKLLVDITKLNDTLKQHVTKLEQLRYSKKELMGKKDQRKTLVARIGTKKQSIEDNENNKVDLRKEKEATHEAVLVRSQNKLKLLLEHQEATKKRLEAGMAKTKFTIKHAACRQQIAAIEEEATASNSRLTILQNELSALTINVEHSREEAKRQATNAQKILGCSVTNLPKHTKEAFAELPATIDELDEIYERLQAQADCMAQINENVVAQYEEWQKKVAILTDELEKAKTKLDKFMEEMGSIKDAWLTPLRQLVHDINIRFSHYFKSIGCVGEVSLDAGEDENDFSDYGIKIKVQYRSGVPLQALTPFQQSGGERSVATILFLLALQDIVKLPFCCVDEINQGMDSTNERRVYQLMTETLCRENQTQYFMVTPKLLPGLEVKTKVVFHLVCNGTIQLTQTDWDIPAMLQRRRALQ